MAVARWLSATRVALVAGAAAALLACASGPGGVQYASEGLGLESVDGLRRVDNWGFGLAFVKPGVDLARYDSAIIDDVTIAYKEPSHPARANRHGIQSGTYLLSPYAAKSLKYHLRKTLTAELGKSEFFAVTEQPAPNALRVTGYIIDLVVHSPPDWGVGKAASQFLTNRGEFILVLDVSDAQSGATLIRVANRTMINFDGGNGHLPANSATNVMAVRLAFQQAGLRLRLHLDDVHALSEIPPAPKLARNGG
jgi:hypothetical protein